MPCVSEHIEQVDHVVIALEDIAPAIPLFRDALGGRFIAGGDNPLNGMRIVHLELPGMKLELLAPLREDSQDTFGALLQFVQTNRDWNTPTRDFALEDVLAGRVQWRDHVPCLDSRPPTP